jgi:hypothetical protein
MGKNKMKMNVRNKLLEGLLLYNRSDMTVHQQRKIATYLKESRYTINTLLTEQDEDAKSEQTIEDIINNTIESELSNDNNNDNKQVKDRDDNRGDDNSKPKPIREKGFYIQTKLADIAGDGAEKIEKWIETFSDGDYICRAITNSDTYKDLWTPYSNHKTASQVLGYPDTPEGQPINGLQMYNTAIRCINKDNMNIRFMLFAFRRIGDKWKDSEKIVFKKHKILTKNSNIPRNSDGTFNIDYIITDFTKQGETTNINADGKFKYFPKLNSYFTGELPSGINLYDNASPDTYQPSWQPSANKFNWDNIPPERKIIGRLYAASQGIGTWVNEYISAIQEIKSYTLLKQVSEYMQFIADLNVKNYFDMVAGMDADKFADQYYERLKSSDWVNWIKSLDSADLNSWGNSSVKPLKNGIYFAAGLHKDYIYKSSKIYIAGKTYDQSPLCTQIIGEFDRDEDGYKTIYNYFKTNKEQFKLNELFEGTGLVNSTLNFALKEPY